MRDGDKKAIQSHCRPSFSSRARESIYVHIKIYGDTCNWQRPTKKRLLLNRSLSKHRLGLRWEKGDSAPLKTPGLLTDDGLREMMKALSGAVAWVLHDAAAACMGRTPHVRGKEGALSKPQSDAHNS